MAWQKIMAEDGSYQTVIYNDKEHQPTLKQMQDFVGGYIQIIDNKDGDQFIIDEEGRLKGKPVNPDASEMWLGEDWNPDNDFRNLVGDVMVLRGEAKVD
jgi:hypothetical protein